VHSVIAAAVGSFAFLRPTVFVTLFGKAQSDAPQMQLITDLSQLYGAMSMAQAVLTFTFATHSDTLVSCGAKRWICGAYALFCWLSESVCLKALLLTKSSHDVSGWATAVAFALLGVMYVYHAVIEGVGRRRKGSTARPRTSQYCEAD